MIGSEYIGKYVLVRTLNEGINAGFLSELSEKGCVITEARRLWKHKPLDPSMSWYEGCALSGLHPDSMVSSAVAVKVIVEDYSLTLCDDTATENIRAFPANPQQ